MLQENTPGAKVYDLTENQISLRPINHKPIGTKDRKPIDWDRQSKRKIPSIRPKPQRQQTRRMQFA